MKIAIHTAELDESRIDGTRVYISEILSRMVQQAKRDDFYLYHRKSFNPVFHVPREECCYDITCAQFPAWTQTHFAARVWVDRPDILWIPVHNMPRLRRKGLITVVTIHDLAFKFFPEMFPLTARHKLNIHTDYAVKHADHIIAVSEATKCDLLAYYEYLRPEQVTVVHHGFDPLLWQEKSSKKEQKKTQKRFAITKPYICYVGAVQPRKNIQMLITTFESLRRNHDNLQLVIVGADAWMADAVHKKAKHSPYAKDIIFTGGVSFDILKTILQGASVFVYPSLYEGFGLPILEAFAAGVPVVTSDNSSLREIAGDGALLCGTRGVDSCGDAIVRVLFDEVLRKNLITQGKARLTQFSWDKAAQETLEVLYTTQKK